MATAAIANGASTAINTGSGTTVITGDAAHAGNGAVSINAAALADDASLTIDGDAAFTVTSLLADLNAAANHTQPSTLVAERAAGLEERPSPTHMTAATRHQRGMGALAGPQQPRRRRRASRARQLHA